MNKLIEKLEKLTNKKVILTEESPKQNAVVEYLKTHPGATIPQMSLDIWNKDYDKLKGTSLVTTVVRTIGAAFENGLIFRDEAAKPYKYYARSIKLPEDGVKRDLKYGTKPGRFSQTPQTPEPIVPIVAQKRTYDEYVKLITDYLKVHVGIPVKDLFQFFPTQISAVPVLQKMLKTGVIVKDNNQRPALWYLKGTEPAGANTTIQPKAPKIYKEKDGSIIKKIIEDTLGWRRDFRFTNNNGNGDYMVEVNFYNGKFNVYIPTVDRGPRTDHGGGEDGDGWLSQSEIERLRKPYINKYKPYIDEVSKALKSKGYKVTGSYVDYGEKGHISLSLNIG